jgi:hypothetical protein
MEKVEDLIIIADQLDSTVLRSVVSLVNYNA